MKHIKTYKEVLNEGLLKGYDEKSLIQKYKDKPLEYRIELFRDHNIKGILTDNELEEYILQGIDLIDKIPMKWKGI